jgi:hypothetical protein
MTPISLTQADAGLANRVTGRSRTNLVAAVGAGGQGPGQDERADADRLGDPHHHVAFLACRQLPLA